MYAFCCHKTSPQEGNGLYLVFDLLDMDLKQFCDHNPGLRFQHSKIKARGERRYVVA